MKTCLNTFHPNPETEKNVKNYFTSLCSTSNQIMKVSSRPSYTGLRYCKEVGNNFFDLILIP